MYSDTIALLSYIQVDQSDSYDANIDCLELYNIIEKDMVEAGFKSVIALCDNDNDFYKKLGFHETKKYDEERLWKSLGAQIIYNQTMKEDL